MRDSFGFPSDENAWGQSHKALMDLSTRANGKRLLSPEAAARILESNGLQRPPRQRLNLSLEQKLTVAQIALNGGMAHSTVYGLIRGRMTQHEETPEQALQAIADQFLLS